jgi:predicted AlkP superfamily phosphohydrolase/phosphomutase
MSEHYNGKQPRTFSRRELLRAAGMALPAVGAARLIGAGRASAAKKRASVIVLGLDGMDPRLVKRFVREGRMPNAKKLIEAGTFSPLGTSMPPQSPVAWSNFISGANPGVHGIFDFIHREPDTLVPYLSTSRTTPSGRTLKLGGWTLPLSGGKIELLRKGPTFWTDLEKHCVDCTIVKIPANFPPTPCRSRTLSGMGTPDVTGSPGNFTYFTSDPAEVREDVGGGDIFLVTIRNGKAECELKGPRNSYRKDTPDTRVPLTVFRDETNPVAKLVVQGQEILLKEGEWSDWVRVEFNVIPHVKSLPGICRLYLKRVHPHLGLYVTPINIDPADPAMPICTPEGYSSELAQNAGPFYTQGLPEDTKALSEGVLTDGQYREQATLVFNERLGLYDYALPRFDHGLFFFYFSSLDLNSHMFWRAMDKEHPQYSPELEKKHGDFIPWLYSKMDEVIGKAMQRVGDDDMLIIMSDHGFTSFRRGFNLNTWLLENGYAALINRFSQEEADFFSNTDWAGTRAYGLGINALYLNIRNREFSGVVSPGNEARVLADELVARLCEVKDPKTGERVIANVHKREDIYSGSSVNEAPDLLVGYNENYRASWETILGKYPRELIVDNDDPWSGDHCMDSSLLPGTFICNRKTSVTNPTLSDLGPTILAYFGTPKPSEMSGRSLL